MKRGELWLVLAWGAGLFGAAIQVSPGGTARVLAAPAGESGSPPLSLRFREVSRVWGIDFRHHHGGTGEFYMIETMGSGVVVFDYDGDGDQDLFFVDSGAIPGDSGEPSRSRLFRNDGPGRFVDVTDRSGIRVRGYGMGATAGDVDGDGNLDLYVTAFGPNQLFRNNGDGTFTDVTREAGVGDGSWGTSAAFADVDRDGDLDLYVTNYVDFSFDNNPICGQRDLGLRSYCHPDVYNGLADRFYRNRGDGTFEDATTEGGFGEADGKGLGVIFGDLDGDGWTDLYVANDMTRNFLFRNRGDGTFEEIGMLAGAAFNDQGQVEAGMGVDLGDVDGNGHFDIVVTHLDLQTNALYTNAGGWIFRDARFTSRLAEPSLYKVGFGTVFADFDQDGDLDLLVANGHIIHNVDQWGTGTTYRQRNQLFENLGGGVFREVEEAGLERVESSRGLACGDLDGDGDLDCVVSNSNAPAEVYENVTESRGNWLQVDLVARGANRFGVGACLEAEGGGVRQIREVRTGASYLSQNALTVHFGVGGVETVDRLQVRWPGGGVQVFPKLPAGRRLTLYESAGTSLAPP